MKSTSLTRRLLASAAGLTIAAAGAVAVASPAYATGGHHGGGHGGSPVALSMNVTGSPTCDDETGESTVDWTVTNDAEIAAEITNVVADGELDGDIEVGTSLAPGGTATASQDYPADATSGLLEVELTWTWYEKEWYWVDGRFPWSPKKKEWKWVEKTKTKTASDGGDLVGCEAPPPPPTPPNIIVVSSCDDLVFIVDNVGDAEATVELTPNTTVDYGPATGFSYSIDPETSEVEAIVDEDASIDLSEEADESNPAVVGPVAPGADPTALGFAGSEGLEITVGLILNGEAVEFEEGENVVSFDDETAELDCDEGGEGGELPVTGSSTTVIALAAVVLLAVGGGMFLIARRRRIRFTA